MLGAPVRPLHLQEDNGESEGGPIPSTESVPFTPSSTGAESSQRSSKSSAFDLGLAPFADHGRKRSSDVGLPEQLPTVSCEHKGRGGEGKRGPLQSLWFTVHGAQARVPAHSALHVCA